MWKILHSDWLYLWIIIKTENRKKREERERVEGTW